MLLLKRESEGHYGSTWFGPEQKHTRTVANGPRPARSSACASGCMLIVPGGGFAASRFCSVPHYVPWFPHLRLLSELCTQHRRFCLCPEVQARGSFRCLGNYGIASQTSNLSELDCTARSLRQQRARLRHSTEVAQPWLAADEDRSHQSLGGARIRNITLRN